MGYRLTGPSVEAADGYDILSDGIVYGSIQISGSGEPIVMMADRQTTGGYAKIASVITVDLPLFAQLRPGQKVRFEKCTVQEAQKLLLQEDKMWKDHCRMLEENSPDNYNPCRFRVSDAGRNRPGCRSCRRSGWAVRTPGRIRRKAGRKSAGRKSRLLRDKK
jgi:hypothetical protein